MRPRLSALRGRFRLLDDALVLLWFVTIGWLVFVLPKKWVDRLPGPDPGMRIGDYPR